MADQATEWPKRITLTKPVQAHEDEVTVLILNEPTGGDLMTLPMEVEDGTKMVLPTLELASRMARVPPSTIKSLNYQDAMLVMKVVNPLAGQFLETLGT
ncbi:phage tail assembly protein [Amphritea sp. HPY]|uniref:phage tail assembly protein n=1 Tax=Amphritea sp. HPY TaxID=3421652 RepID=UPI003D7CA89B